MKLWSALAVSMNPSEHRVKPFKNVTVGGVVAPFEM